MANVGPMLRATLARYGLESLADWVSQRIIDGATPDEIELELYDRPEFKARFPAIFERERNNLPPVSVDEYLAYEQYVSTVSRALGVQVTPDEVHRLLALNISTAEVQERIGMASAAVYFEPQEIRDQLFRLYGVTQGDLARYFMDPKTELPKLQRRFAAAQVAGAAANVGFARQLTQAQAEMLVDHGMDAQSARQGFALLTQSRELFQQADRTEQDIGVDRQLRLLTGDVQAAEEAERRAERRRAVFEAGGGFASGRTGVGGLGSAER